MDDQLRLATFPEAYRKQNLCQNSGDRDWSTKSGFHAFQTCVAAKQ